MNQLWNTFKTTLLLGGLTGLFLFIGAALGGSTGMVIALVLAIAMNMGTWWFSDKLALKFSGARRQGSTQGLFSHDGGWKRPSSKCYD